MSGFRNISRSNDRTGRIRYFRVALKDRERSACKNRCCGVFISGAVPPLNDPVIEYHARRSCWSRAGYDKRVIFIESGVGRSVAASRSIISIIFNADTVSADDNLAPLCVKVEFFRYPETVAPVITCNIAIPGCTIAPFIHGVGKIGFFIVRRAASDLLIRCENIRAGFIFIPSVEFISGSQAFRDRNLSAVGYAEVHCLIIRTPVKSGVCSGIGMKEYTVLDLTPFRVDRQAAFGHGGEGIGFGAGRIYIPTFENIAFGSGRCVVVCASFVVRREIRAINNIVYLMELSSVRLIKEVAVTVRVYTIHEVDRILITSVVEAYGSVVVKIRASIIVCRI